MLSTATTIEFEDYGVTKGNDFYKWYVYSTGTHTPQRWGYKTITAALKGLKLERRELAKYRARLRAKGIVK